MSGQSPFRPRNPVLSVLRNIIQGLRRTRLRLHLRNRLVLGRDVAFARGVDLRPPQSLKIADRVSFGQKVIVETNLDVGPDTLISSCVSFVGNDHAFDDPTTTVYAQGRLPPSTVILEGDNLIGFGSIIVGNVRIGRGCIVGAGAVVTGDLPANTVCVGVPAHPIRARFPSQPAFSANPPEPV